MFFRRFIPEPLGQVNPLVRGLALLFMVALFVFIASTNRPKQSAADQTATTTQHQESAQTAILVMPNNSADSGNISVGAPQGARYQVSVNAGDHGTTYNLYGADGKAILMGVSLQDIRRQYPEVDVTSLEAAERAAKPQ